MPNLCKWCAQPIAPGTVHTPTVPCEACTVTPTGVKQEPPSANKITADLLIEIPQRWPGSIVFRVNVMAGYMRDRFVRSVTPGVSDILGVVNGHAIAIEVKSGRDRMRQAQTNFRAAWIRAGGIHLIAHEAARTLEDLDHLVRNRHV